MKTLKTTICRHMLQTVLLLSTVFLTAMAHKPETNTIHSNDEIPMSRYLTTNDWETIDTMWGVCPPERHICVMSGGFRLRNQLAFFGGEGCATPCCVNYGGCGAIGVQTIQVKGKAGQTVNFVQGSGSKPMPPK